MMMMAAYDYDDDNNSEGWDGRQLHVRGGGGDRQQCGIVVVVTAVAAVGNGLIPQHPPTTGPFCGSPLLSFNLESKLHEKQPLLVVVVVSRDSAENIVITVPLEPTYQLITIWQY
jgi:hypothetical protein